MQKTLKLVLFAILLSSFFILPCAGEGNTEGPGNSSSRPQGPGGPGGPGSDQQGPGGEERPVPSDSEIMLLRLTSLMDSAQAKPSLAISAEQASAIIPILQDWETMNELDPDASVENIITLISDELTEAQNLFFPAPPNDQKGTPPSGQKGGERPDSSKGQEPPSQESEEMDISIMITELIEDMSSL